MPSSEHLLHGTLSNLSEKYQLTQVLGQGTFGVVRKCIRRDTGQVLACKTIAKSKIPNLQIMQREIDIMKEVDHPHIVKLYDVYEDQANIHLVTELCTGGELYDRVIEKAQSPSQHFSEYDAARIIRNILDAISYCHDVKHVVHRDLKPENFLLLNERDDAPVKIIDFGLSRHAGDNGDKLGIMTSRVGTPYYVAPEVLTGKYTNKCDIWSIGVIAYVLLCGFPPFFAENERKILEMVQHGTLKFPSPIWDDISSDAKKFVKRLLNRNPKKRPTASEALQDPWLLKDQVQPEGTSRRASFLPAGTTSTLSLETEENGGFVVKSLNLKHEKQTMFHKFLGMMKVKKANAAHNR